VPVVAVDGATRDQMRLQSDGVQRHIAVAQRAPEALEDARPIVPEEPEQHDGTRHRGHGQRPQLAGADEFDRGRQVVEGHLHLPAHKVGEHRGRATIGHMRHCVSSSSPQKFLLGIRTGFDAIIVS